MKELDTIEKFYGWNFNTENKLKTLDENSKQYIQLQQQRTFIFDHLKKSLSSEASYCINLIMIHSSSFITFKKILKIYLLQI